MQIKENLKGKRLLLLGGTYNAEMIKKYAVENDIILVSTGDSPNDHPLVNISDIFAKGNVKSASDISRVIVENKIDGVFPGGNEDVIPVCIKAAKQTGINCYVTQEQWDITANKRVFKNVCKKFDVPVVPEYSMEDIVKNEKNVNYPVIVKPIDGSGSRGVFLAFDKDELLEYSQKALDSQDQKKLWLKNLCMGILL